MKRSMILLWLSFIFPTIYPNLSYAKHNFDPPCDENTLTVDIYDTLTDSCEVTLKDLDCENLVPEEQRRSCDKDKFSSVPTHNYFITSPIEAVHSLHTQNSTSDEKIFEGCATGIWEYGEETLSAITGLMTSPPTMWSVGIQVLTSGITMASYFHTEYERALDQVSDEVGPTKKRIGALKLMKLKMSTFVVTKAKEAIEEEVTHFQCLNAEAQMNMLCGFLSEIFIPPTGGIAFLKVGKAAATRFPNIARAFTKLNNILPDAVNEEKLHRFMDADEKMPGSNRSLRFQERLKSAQRKLRHVINNSNEAVVFHGSGSASLLAFTSNKSMGGLRPTGELLREGKAPFTGELGVGTSGIGARKGINNNNLSTVKITDLDASLEYLGGERRVDNGYSLRRSQETIEENRARLEGIQRNEPINSLDRNHPELATSILSNRMEVEQQRVAQWGNLSRRDQNLVQENFPVLYGIKPTTSRNIDTNRIDTRGGETIEVNLNGGADFNEITSLFVPRNKIRLVNAILEENGIHHIQISPIEPVLNNR